MNNKNSITKEIRITFLKIQEEHPELAKYLTEMPEHYHTNQSNGVNDKDLKEYLDSLNQMLKTQAKKD
jgi:hypothetical protein